VETSPQTKRKWRWGFHRWLIILIIIANIFVARAYTPVMPHIQVPAEALTDPISLPLIGELSLTNTMFATLIADLLLILMAFVVWRATAGGKLILEGIASVIEAILEALYNMVEATSGKRARSIFPWVATIVLLVLVVNWMELIPGVDSIGVLHEPHHGAPAYATEEVFRVGDFAVNSITEEVEVEEGENHIEHTEDAHLSGFTPYVRVASTDLNFTIALALTSVVVTQVIGIRAVGLPYFKKFFNFGRLGKMLFKENLNPFELIFPFVDVFVGLLELISEFAKIISFSFRLFGNIFAGSVLLFVMGSLIPVLLQSGFLGLELFVGLMQALVFGMLTLVFMSMATIAHDDHNGEQAETH
jgi:F-type H+-transporting ATPase subunit a